MAQRKKSQTVIGIAVVVCLLATAIVLRLAFRKTNDYTLVKAATGNVATSYSFSGSVEAGNRQTVYADQTMQIKEIDVSAGQDVKKDDVLMKTTAGEKIKAPMDGEISQLYVNPDSQAMAGTKLCEVTDYSNLKLVVQVDEYDLSAVSVGKTASVNIHALGKTVTGTVSDVAKEGVYSGGVTYFDTTLTLPADPDLRVGMSADVTMLNQSVQNVVTLPMDVIQFRADNTPYVEEPDGRRSPRKVSVTLGISDGTTVEVRNGVAAGTEVIKPAQQATSSSTGFGALRAGNRSAGSGTTNAGTGATSTVQAGGTG